MPPETVTDVLSGTATHQPRMDGAWHPLGLTAQGAMDPARDKLHATLSASKEVQSAEYGDDHMPGILPPHPQALPAPPHCTRTAQTQHLLRAGGGRGGGEGHRQGCGYSWDLGSFHNNYNSEHICCPVLNLSIP